MESNGNENKPKIPASIVKAEILRHIDVQGFYESYLNGQRLRPKSDGWCERVKCPIHNDQGNPNFFVNLTTGKSKCFACNFDGSIFDFWIHYHKRAGDTSAFKDAIIALASYAGVNIEAMRSDVTKINKIREQEAAAREERKKREENLVNGTFEPERHKAREIDNSTTPIPKSTYIAFHKSLTTEHYEFLLKRRGIKKATIESFFIGWDDSCPSKDQSTGEWVKGAYTIPILNEAEQCRNIRVWSSVAEPQYKMRNFVLDKGKATERKFGSPPRLFCLNILKRLQCKNVVICEGEWDCILLNQHLAEFGMNDWCAVTGTHGVNTFEQEWIPELLGKNVYICFDCDEEGKHGAHNVVNKYFLNPIKAGRMGEVKIVELPLSGTKESKDITDFFLKEKKSIDDFVYIVKNTPAIISGGVNDDDATIKPIVVDSLVTALKDRRYIDRRVQVPITVSGTTSNVFHAIREYKVFSCPLMAKGECCCQDTESQEIPYGDPLFIAACMRSTSDIMKAVAARSCQKSMKCKIAIIKKVVMEEHFAHQVITRWKVEERDGRLENAQDTISVPIYILQPDNGIKIEPQDYTATGWIRTHPHTNVATLFVESLTPIHEDWRSFTLEKGRARETILEMRKLTIQEIMSDLTRHVTRIYKSDTILYAILLAYLSPLWFYFNGAKIRGWLNIVIMGDSGTGKSASYRRISDFLDLGDIFSALSGGRTGLLYAIKQKSGEWHVSAGRYVQASGGILAVDEMQELKAEEVKRMAIAMETGVLEVEQVASITYNTLVRTLFLMNPKDAAGNARAISDFVYGCDALKNCFAPMFIRRIDFAVFTTTSTSHEFYNEAVDSSVKTSPQKVTAGMLKTLIYWMWTRTPDQIIWSDAATKKCLEMATKMSGIYGFCDDVPLVNANDFREKLSRLSVAYAALDRSISDDAQKLIVEERHVIEICNIMEMSYDSPACKLKKRSLDTKKVTVLNDYPVVKSAIEAAIEMGRSSINPEIREANHFCQLLLFLERLPVIPQRQLADMIGVSDRWCRANLAILLGHDLAQTTRHGIAKTRKFNLFIERWRSEDGVSAMLDDVFLKLASMTKNLEMDSFAEPSRRVPYGYVEQKEVKPLAKEDNSVSTVNNTLTAAEVNGRLFGDEDKEPSISGEFESPF